jgi:hypothetical protein
MLAQSAIATINPADYRFFLITGSIQFDEGVVLPIFISAHARRDDWPAGEVGGTEIAARVLRQATQEAHGEAEAAQEDIAAAGGTPGATWRELRVLELQAGTASE